MSGIATAIIGGAVIGGLATNAASNRQASAAGKAQDATNAQNALNNANAKPWITQGQSAVNTLGDLTGTSGNTSAPGYGDLTRGFTAADLNSNLAPNYQWQLQTGIGATTNAGNAAGFSGNTLTGINNWAQNYAGNAYQNAFNNFQTTQTNKYNRIADLAGLGQTAANNNATQGNIATGNAGQFGVGVGQAQASGIVGASNAVTGGMGNLAGFNYLNGITQQPSYSGYMPQPSSTAPGSSGIGADPYAGYKDGGPVYSLKHFADGGIVNGWGGPRKMLPGGVQSSGEDASGQVPGWGGWFPHTKNIGTPSTELPSPPAIQSPVSPGAGAWGGVANAVASLMPQSGKATIGGNTLNNVSNFGPGAAAVRAAAAIMPATTTPNVTPQTPIAQFGFPGTSWPGGQTDSTMTEIGGNWGQPLTNGSGQNPGGGEESNMSYIQAPQGWTPPWMQSAPTQPGQPGTKSDIQPIMGGKMADGGAVSGPGGPRDDKVPAMLSDGEHVWTAAEVNAMGGGDNALGQRKLTRLRELVRMGARRG